MTLNACQRLLSGEIARYVFHQRVCITFWPRSFAPPRRPGSRRPPLENIQLLCIQYRRLIMSNVCTFRPTLINIQPISFLFLLPLFLSLSTLSPLSFLARLMDRQLDKLFTQFLNVTPFPSPSSFLSLLETLLSSPCVLAILPAS